MAMLSIGGSNRGGGLGIASTAPTAPKRAFILASVPPSRGSRTTNCGVDFQLGPTCVPPSSYQPSGFRNALPRPKTQKEGIPGSRRFPRESESLRPFVCPEAITPPIASGQISNYKLNAIRVHSLKKLFLFFCSP